MKNAKFFKAGAAMAVMLLAAITAQASTFNMTGGKIIDNTGSSGVTTFTDGSSITITIGGTAVISGNVNNSGAASNLHLQGEGSYLVISSGDDAPKEGMSVGVRKGTNLDDGVFVQSGATAEHLQYFFSDINLATGIEVITIEHDPDNGGRLSLKRVPPTFADLIFHETENLSPRKYTGTAQKVELTGTARNASSTNYLGGSTRIYYEGTEGTDHPKNWQAMYNPTNVGKYAVTLTSAENAAWDLGYGPVTDLPLGTLIIYSDDNKPVPTADLLAYDLTTPVTYTGSPQSVTVTPKPNIHGLGAITVYYDDGSGEGKSTTAPTNAGTYAITVDIAEGGDPTSGWGAAEGLSLGNFVIDKAAAPTITFPTSTPIIYGAALSTSTLSNGSTVYGSFAWTDGETVIPTVTNSGYEVTFTPSAGTVNNYETITTTTEIVAVTVNRANGAGTPTLNAVANWTYNGTPSAVTVSGDRSAEQTTANVIIEYKAQSADDATYTAVVPMQAGNYTARARWAQSANYLAHVISGTQNFTINKANQSAPSDPTMASKTTTTITLAIITGAEYSRDNGATWQDAVLFEGLTPNTPYTFVARLKAAANYNASPNSAASAAITTDKAALTGTVAISGSAVYGQILTAVTTALTSEPAITSLGAFSYQWFRHPVGLDGLGALTPIDGANGSTYTLAPEDIGRKIRVIVSAANCDGTAWVDIASEVAKATPTITTNPTAAGITYGAALSTSNLTGGAASVAGAFAWQTGATIPTVTNSGYAVIFTPTDAANYNSVVIPTIAIAVAKATPTITTNPTAAGITYGAALSTSNLTGGVASVAGSFAWQNGATIPTVTNTGYPVVFTPTDAANYNSVVIPAIAISVGTTSILSGDRNIPQTPDNSAVVIAPINVTAFEITVGPNPVRGADGVVNIFLSGRRVDDGTLTIYDATGNVINKITIRDNAVIGNNGRRVVGSWDLKDGKGNHVSAGSYLLRGSVKTVDGNRERVSVIVGVR